MKTFIEQYVTFWVALNELAPDTQNTEAEHAVYSAAYKTLEQAYRRLKGQRFTAADGPDNEGVERYELCADDGGVEERAGALAWPVSIFTAQSDLPVVVLTEFRKCLCEAFAVEASNAGMAFRILDVSRQAAYRVTENSSIELPQ